MTDIQTLTFDNPATVREMANAMLSWADDYDAKMKENPPVDLQHLLETALFTAECLSSYVGKPLPDSSDLDMVISSFEELANIADKCDSENKNALIKRLAAYQANLSGANIDLKSLPQTIPFGTGSFDFCEQIFDNHNNILAKEMRSAKAKRKAHVRKVCASKKAADVLKKALNSKRPKVGAKSAKRKL